MKHGLELVVIALGSKNNSVEVKKIERNSYTMQGSTNPYTFSAGILGVQHF